MNNPFNIYKVECSEEGKSEPIAYFEVRCKEKKVSLAYGRYDNNYVNYGGMLLSAQSARQMASALNMIADSLDPLKNE